MGKSMLGKQKVVERVFSPDRTGTVGKLEAKFAYNKISDRYDFSVDGTVLYSHLAGDVVLRVAKSRHQVEWA